MCPTAERWFLGKHQRGSQRRYRIRSQEMHLSCKDHNRGPSSRSVPCLGNRCVIRGRSDSKASRHRQLRKPTDIMQIPGNLCHSGNNREALDELLENHAIKQVAGHASSKCSHSFHIVRSADTLCSSLCCLGTTYSSVLSRPPR